LDRFVAGFLARLVGSLAGRNTHGATFCCDLHRTSGFSRPLLFKNVLDLPEYLSRVVPVDPARDDRSFRRSGNRERPGVTYPPNGGQPGVCRDSPAEYSSSGEIAISPCRHRQDRGKR
jgi:hypothetical protein